MTDALSMLCPVVVVLAFASSCCLTDAIEVSKADQVHVRKYMDEICPECECASKPQLDCGKGCLWNDRVGLCEYDVRAAFVVPDMLQCDPLGGCQICIRMNTSAQCGFKSYPTQRVNCTWDASLDKCLPDANTVEAVTVAGMLAPRRAYQRNIDRFYKRCKSYKAGKNCSAESICKNVIVDHDRQFDHCTLDHESAAYREFFRTLGFSDVYVNRSSLCDGLLTQFNCLSNGCYWKDLKCSPGPDYTCKSICKVRYPQRMEYAYRRQSKLQCGDPCDENDSELPIGTDGKAYDSSELIFAEAVCGPVCDKDPECRGFNAVNTLRRCLYRRSTTCYTRSNPDRDCFTKKAKCSTLSCPKGYLPLPDEQDSYCNGMTCNLGMDLHTCCGKALCTDTEDWYSLTGCRADGFSLGQGCTSQGFTCKAYEIWGWCKPSDIARGVIVPGARWALGSDYNSPTKHCCICGGGVETLPYIDYGPKPPELANETLQPPMEHLCCVGLNVGREFVRAVMPEPLNRTAMKSWNCMNLGEPADSRVGAACTYCLCLFDDGADFLKKPECCSLRSSVPGIDRISGKQMCSKYMPRYNMEEQRIRSCELRHDLYMAVGSASERGRLATFTAVAISVLAGVMAVSFTA